SFLVAGAGARLAARTLLADLQDELAVLGELQDVRVWAAVAADPDVPLVVDEDPVVAVGPLVALAGAAPVPQQVARLVELEDRRGARAAQLRGLLLDPLLVVGERRRATMHDPDVIVGIDKDADRLSEHPVIRHRLRPERIDFEPRRLDRGLALRVGRSVE